MKLLPASIPALMIALMAPAAPLHAEESAPKTDGAAPSTRGLYLQLIRQARAGGRPRAALAYLDDFDRQYAGDPEARLLRINCLLDVGDIAAAEAATDRLPADATGPESNLARAHVLAARGQWGQAAREYALAAGAAPADPFTRNALGYAELRLGEWDKAIENLRSAADLDPASPVIRNNLLLALTMGGRQAEAEAALARIAEPAARTRLQTQITAEAARLAALSPAPKPAQQGS